MNIEIKITAESVEEARAAFAQLAGERPATHITVVPRDTKVTGGELTIPAGTDLTIADVTRDGVMLKAGPDPEPLPAPEKPKRKRMSKQAAELAAESAQEPAGAPEAPQAATTPTEPEKPAESAVEAPAAKAPTLAQISEAGAKLLDDNPKAMQPLLNLLGDFGVQAITQLKQDQLGAFAARLRELEAEV